MAKVIISGDNPAHEASVKQAFLSGYAIMNGMEVTSDDVVIIDNLTTALNTAKNDLDVVMFVRSYQGYEALEVNAKDLKDRVLFVMPLGSNDYVEITQSFRGVGQIVTTACGDTQNRTAYGDGLEFWDINPLGGIASSFSNGYIAGKLLAIKEKLASEQPTISDWTNVRMYARFNSSRGVVAIGIKSQTEGYGKIKSYNEEDFAYGRYNDAYGAFFATEEIKLPKCFRVSESTEFGEGVSDYLLTLRLTGSTARVQMATTINDASIGQKPLEIRELTLDADSEFMQDVYNFIKRHSDRYKVLPIINN